jgi:hypothetical protein
MKSGILIILFSLQLFAVSNGQDTLWFCDPWTAEDPRYDCNNYFGVYFEDDDKMPIHMDTSKSGNIWQIGTTSKFNLSSPDYGKSIMTDTLYPYPTNTYSSFEIICIGWFQDGLDIGFIHQYETELGQDGGTIEIFNQSEKVWQGLYEFPNDTWFSGYSESDTVASLGNKPGFSGKTDQWEYVLLQIHNYPTELDTVKLRFVFASDSTDAGLGGWIIDNIDILGMYEGIETAGYDHFHSIAYPNPASNSLLIEFDNPESKTFHLTIYDSLGRQVLLQEELSANQVEINIQQYRSGIYYYKLLNEEEKEGSWGKFIVE